MISVIVPIYNQEKYLANCLNSIVNQTYKDIEIILINDGSVDNSLKICEDFKKNDVRIKIISQENKGVSIARNNGFLLSQGEYVIYIDSDDELELDMLECLLNNIESTYSDISICSYKRNICNKYNENYIDENICKVYNKEQAQIAFFENTFGVGVCNKLIIREIADKVRFVEGKKYNEDKFYLFEALSLADKVCFQNAYKYIYYYRENSVTTQKFSESRFDILSFSNVIHDRCKNMSMQIQLLAKRNLIIDHLSIFRRIFIIKNKNAIINQFYNKINDFIINADIKDVKNLLFFKIKLEIFIIKYCRTFYPLLIKIYYRMRKIK